MLWETREVRWDVLQTTDIFDSSYLGPFRTALASRQRIGCQDGLQGAEALHVQLGKGCLHAESMLRLCEESACSEIMSPVMRLLGSSQFLVPSLLTLQQSHTGHHVYPASILWLTPKTSRDGMIVATMFPEFCTVLPHLATR